MQSTVLATTTFVPIPDDYAAAYALSLTGPTKSYRWWARFVLCTASWSATAVSLLTAGAFTLTSALTGAVLSLGFIFFFTAKMWPDPEKQALRRYNSSQNPALKRNRTFQLEELGVRYFSDVDEYWLSWSVVRRVNVTEEHLFVSSRSMTLFVPARAFDGRAAFLDFVRIAQGHYEPEPETAGPRGFAVVMNGGSNKDSVAPK